MTIPEGNNYSDEHLGISTLHCFHCSSICISVDDNIIMYWFSKDVIFVVFMAILSASIHWQKFDAMGYNWRAGWIAGWIFTSCFMWWLDLTLAAAVEMWPQQCIVICGQTLWYSHLDWRLLVISDTLRLVMCTPKCSNEHACNMCALLGNF